MKKIFSIAVLGSLAVMPVWAGSWGAMHTRTCGGANEYYRLDNAGRYCLECDDDEGDAAAKTRVYWENSQGRVRTRKCYISPYRDGDDKWTDAEWPTMCKDHKCPSGNPVVKLPTSNTKFDTYICGKANRPVKSWYDSALVQGGTSDAMDCYFTACDANHPVGSKKNAKCTVSQDPNATECEQVCVGELNSYGLGKARWNTFVKSCAPGYKPGGLNKYGYTTCEKEVVAVVCPEGSSNAFITQESCINKGTFKCTKTSADGIQCLCGKCETAPEKPQESSLDRCLKSRSTAEGKACCYLPNKVATWTNNVCTCVGDSMEFKIGPDGRGTCNAKAPEVGEKFECDASNLAIMQTWAKECATKKPSVVSLVSTIAALCVSDDRTYEKFNTQYLTLLALNPGDCAEVVDDSDEIHNDVSVAQTAISEAVASLDSITSGLEVSKWKDEEGKFNTARLASDSIAGVVLGTAGGLITSSVVKKSQVEDGFEDMSCVIGGQTVANWGDEFTVGVQ